MDAVQEMNAKWDGSRTIRMWIEDVLPVRLIIASNYQDLNRGSTILIDHLHLWLTLINLVFSLRKLTPFYPLLSPYPHECVLTGGFSIDIDNSSYPFLFRFLSTLSAFNMIQHVFPHSQLWSHSWFSQYFCLTRLVRSSAANWTHPLITMLYTLNSISSNLLLHHLHHGHFVASTPQTSIAHNVNRSDHRWNSTFLSK